MTNADKFREVFSEEPYEIELNKTYMCPPASKRGCTKGLSCAKCRSWWEEEYKKPKRKRL